MSFPPDELDAFPAMQAEQIKPNGVVLAGTIHENLVLNFRLDRSPNLDLPSLWRLAKHIVDERGPLLIYRFKEPK